METDIKSIMIPTDFSELSESALQAGISVAKRLGARVILLHVLDRYVYLQPTEVFLPDIRTIPDLNSMIEERIKKISEKISSENDLDVTGRVTDGQPYEEICRIAYEEKVGLIIMGTHGESGLRQFFIGSEAYRVIKHAPCPVLTVPGGWVRMDFKKVLFPIRLVPGSLDKYFYARPIIEKNNSEIYILGLAESGEHVNSGDLPMLVERLKEQLNNDKVKSRTAYFEGDDIAAEIYKKTEELGIDLLILTANIDHDWRSFFIGPFVQKVINHSRIPVLSIKPSDAG
jgi:nucleotide-binding universal stress UspA family protein